MGRFITRIHSGDREKWAEMVDEARRLSQDHVPKRDAIARLVAVAGDNPRAFLSLGRKGKDLRQTPQGREALRLLAEASIEYKYGKQ